MDCESALQQAKEEEEVFEVINGGSGATNTLSLSTYQILSSDPISRISISHDSGEFPIHFLIFSSYNALSFFQTTLLTTFFCPFRSDICSDPYFLSDLIMTCGGNVSQDGVLVLWRPTRDTDKIRWQAEPVTITIATTPSLTEGEEEISSIHNCVVENNGDSHHDSNSISGETT